MTEDEKRCSLCLQNRPPDSFHRDAQKKDGLSSWCKDCSKFRGDHPELSIAQVKLARCENMAEETEGPSEVESPPFAPKSPEKAPRARRQLTPEQRYARNEARRAARAAKKA